MKSFSGAVQARILPIQWATGRGPLDRIFRNDIRAWMAYVNYVFVLGFMALAVLVVLGGLLASRLLTPPNPGVA